MTETEPLFSGVPHSMTTQTAKRDATDNTERNLTCSVVVCTRDRLRQLNECLAVISAAAGPAADVVVIDSGPRYERAEEVALRHGARYAYEARPGLSRARNRAFRECASDILIFVDDDSIPEAGWIGPLMAEFDDPAVGLVGGRILPPVKDEDMLPDYSWFGIVDLGGERRVVDRSDKDWFETAHFHCFVMGGNLAIRRSVIEHWGGFDERLGCGAPIPRGEESKAFFDLVERGYCVVYAPGSVVRHPYSRDWDQLRQRAIKAIEVSVAYVALTLCEQRAYRRKTWGYIRSKLKRVKPLFHRGTGIGKPLVPGYRVLIAEIKGLLMYLSVKYVGRGTATNQ